MSGRLAVTIHQPKAPQYLSSTPRLLGYLATWLEVLYNFASSLAVSPTTQSPSLPVCRSPSPGIFHRSTKFVRRDTGSLQAFLRRMRDFTTLQSLGRKKGVCRQRRQGLVSLSVKPHWARLKLCDKRKAVVRNCRYE